MKVNSNKKFLIIAAHPDDEILGCGASASKLIDAGYLGKTIILGEGATSRLNGPNEKILEELKQNAIEANQIIGINEISFHDLPDNSFDSVPLLEVIRIVESEIDDYNPDIIFTHYGDDLNIDHRITFQAVMTACRPQPDSLNPTIYSFFIPSSTDWTDGITFETFSPNVFIETNGYIEKKLTALKCYKSEMKNYPHSRSIKSLDIVSQYWGNRIGIEHCEPFLLIREIL